MLESTGLLIYPAREKINRKGIHMNTNTLFICGAAILWILEKCGLFAWISKWVHGHLPREKSMAVESLTGSLNRMDIVVKTMIGTENNTGPIMIFQLKTIKSVFKIVDMGVIDVKSKTFYPFTHDSGIIRVYNYTTPETKEEHNAERESDAHT